MSARKTQHGSVRNFVDAAKYPKNVWQSLHKSGADHCNCYIYDSPHSASTHKFALYTAHSIPTPQARATDDLAASAIRFPRESCAIQKPERMRSRTCGTSFAADARTCALGSNLTIISHANVPAFADSLLVFAGVPITGDKAIAICKNAKAMTSVHMLSVCILSKSPRAHSRRKLAREEALPVTWAAKNKFSPMSSNPCASARCNNDFALATHISVIAASASDCDAVSAGGCVSIGEAGDCVSNGEVAMLDGLGAEVAATIVAC